VDVNNAGRNVVMSRRTVATVVVDVVMEDMMDKGYVSQRKTTQKHRYKYNQIARKTAHREPMRNQYNNHKKIK